MIFFVAIASIVVFLFFLFPVTDFDIWFHLAEGKLMIQNWYFPYTDVFSYTAQGAANYPNSWGFTAFSFAAFKLFGLDGLNVIKALVSLSVFLAIVFYLFKEKLLNLFSLSFVTLALFSIREEFSLRPHTFSYLLFVIFVALLFTYKKYRDPRLIGALAVTQFIWVNLHASFIWGLAFTAIFVAYEFIITRKLDRKNLALGGAVFVASLLHLFYGASYLVRLVTERFTPAAFQLPIRDLLPATTATFTSLTGVVLLSLLLVLFMGLKKRHFDILAILLFISIVAALNVRFVRDLVLFLSLTVPSYFPSLKESLLRLPKWVWKAVFFLFLLTLFLLARNSSLGIGLGLERFTYPVRAVEFIKQEQLLEKSNGRLYHTYNFGGYLMWANQPHKVFIDGRVRPYLEGPFAAYWNNFEGGEVWKDSQARYNITVALMTLPHTDEKTIYNVSKPMFPPEEWALIYYDDVGMIYVKRMDELKDVIERYEYSILDPQALDLTYLQERIQSQEEFDAALRELQTGLLINPESFRLHFTLAYVYSLAGIEKQMIAELEKTLEINPYFGPAKNILNQL